MNGTTPATSSTVSSNGEDLFAHAKFIDILINNEAITADVIAQELVRHLTELAELAAQNSLSDAALNNLADHEAAMRTPEIVGCCGIISGICSNTNSKYGHEVAK